MKCPECGGDMEEGNITAVPKRVTTRLYWMIEEGFFRSKGEFLTGGLTDGLKGHRCPRCHLVMAHYDPV